MAAQARSSACYFSLQIRNLNGPNQVIKCDLDKQIGQVIREKLSQSVKDIHEGYTSSRIGVGRDD